MRSGARLRRTAGQGQISVMIRAPPWGGPTASALSTHGALWHDGPATMLSSSTRPPGSTPLHGSSPVAPGPDWASSFASFKQPPSAVSTASSWLHRFAIRGPTAARTAAAILSHPALARPRERSGADLRAAGPHAGALGGLGRAALLADRLHPRRRPALEGRGRGVRAPLHRHVRGPAYAARVAVVAQRDGALCRGILPLRSRGSAYRLRRGSRSHGRSGGRSRREGCCPRGDFRREAGCGDSACRFGS